MTAKTKHAPPYLKYVIAEHQAVTASMSFGAKAVHHELWPIAWAEPSGTMTVEVDKLEAFCDQWGLDFHKTGKELTRSGGWRRDGKQMVALFLLPLRTRTDAIIEKRSYAGTCSGKSPKRAPKGKPAGKGKRGRKPKATTTAPVPEAPAEQPAPEAPAEMPPSSPPTEMPPEHVFNTCSPNSEESPAPGLSFANEEFQAVKNALRRNDLHTCSTHVEHPYQRSSSSSSPPYGRGKEEEQKATAPAASHAGGAAGAVTSPAASTATLAPPAPQTDPDSPFERSAATRLADVRPDEAFRTGDVASLIATLETAAPDVDVERPLFRICAAWQRGGRTNGHIRILREIRLLLDGVGGRVGVVPPCDAARCVALALHGSLIMPEQVQPMALRAVAGTVYREVPDSEPEAPRRAIHVAALYHRGLRHADAFRLPEDPPPAERPALVGRGRTTGRRHG